MIVCICLRSLRGCWGEANKNLSLPKVFFLLLGAKSPAVAGQALDFIGSSQFRVRKIQTGGVYLFEEFEKLLK